MAKVFQLFFFAYSNLWKLMATKRVAKCCTFADGKGTWAWKCLAWVKEISCVSDADAFHRG